MKQTDYFPCVCVCVFSSVADPAHFNTDRDPTFHFDATPSLNTNPDLAI
jgi:hypothetical protein